MVSADRQYSKNDNITKGYVHPPTLPVFDHVELMTRMINDGELIKNCGVFLDSISGKIAELRDDPGQKGVAGIGRQAHSIKGASADVCAASLCNLADDLEKTGNAGNLDTVSSRLPELEKGFEVLKMAKERQLKGE